VCRIGRGPQMMRKISRERHGDHGGSSKRTMRDRWADSIHGMMGEIALARALGLPWTPGGIEVTRGDVANKLEVRATERLSGHLLIYPNEADASIFVLMIGHYPQFRIAGSITAADAKQDQWWRSETDPPCWWVPQKALSPVDNPSFASAR
jgi:hypothetical protein